LTLSDLTQVSYPLFCQGLAELENPSPSDILLSNQEIGETSPAGTVVGTVSTLGHNDTHTYQLISGGQFMLIGQSLQVAAGVAFKRTEYPIKVTSTDADGLSWTKDFTIKIQPQPRFVGEIRTQREQGAQVSIDAPETLTLIGKIYPSAFHLGQLADLRAIYHWTPDGSTDPLTVTQSIAHQQRLETAWEGSLFHNKLIGLAGQFEVELSYQVGSTSYSAPVASLTVRPNRPPQALQLSANTVLENSPPDTLIGTLSTEDLDLQEEFTYSLVGERNPHFKIVGTELRTTDHYLDFEQHRESRITVRSVDLTGAFIDTPLVIQVLDRQTVIEGLRLTRASVLENSPVGTVVGRVWAVGREQDEYAYELLEDDQGNFALQGDNLVVAGVLDYEVPLHHVVRVRATALQSRHDWEQTFTIALHNELDLGVLEWPSATLQLLPDVQHRGQVAELFAVAEMVQDQQTTWRILEKNTKWRAWDLRTQPTIKSVLLGELVELKLGDLSELLGEEVRIYVGYRLASGEVVSAVKVLEP
jgi:hypothetical protein